MKNFFSLLFIIPFACITSSIAQEKKAVLHSNGSVSIFSGNSCFQNAYSAAIHGDTIYLPGGTYASPGNINKSLVIVGSGHYPAFTQASGRTIISGNLQISTEADNLELWGLFLTDNVTAASTNSTLISQVKIIRCNVGAIQLQSGTSTALYSNFLISECVVRGNITASKTNNLIVRNSIFGRLQSVTNAFAYNNISQSAYSFEYCTNSWMYNNIITNTTSPFYNTSNCDIRNSIFVGNPSLGASNTAEGNYMNVPVEAIFSNVTSSSFEYTHDYSLQNPETYIGTDGTQVGIYGGINGPYKEGAIPFNPHISSMIIPTTTNENGELPLEINVIAQPN